MQITYANMQTHRTVLQPEARASFCRNLNVLKPVTIKARELFNMYYKEKSEEWPLVFSLRYRLALVVCDWPVLVGLRRM